MSIRNKSGGRNFAVFFADFWKNIENTEELTESGIKKASAWFDKAKWMR